MRALLRNKRINRQKDRENIYIFGSAVLISKLQLYIVLTFAAHNYIRVFCVGKKRETGDYIDGKKSKGMAFLNSLVAQINFFGANLRTRDMMKAGLFPHIRLLA